MQIKLKGIQNNNVGGMRFWVMFSIFIFPVKHKINI